MSLRSGAALLLVTVTFASTQTAESNGQSVLLTVPAGVPLRLYLAKRVSKADGATVVAKVLAPVYAFDKEVILPGTQVLGHVSHPQPVSKWTRARAILGGDFTPLRNAPVEFTHVLFITEKGELKSLDANGTAFVGYISD